MVSTRLSSIKSVFVNQETMTLKDVCFRVIPMINPDWSPKAIQTLKKLVVRNPDIIASEEFKTLYEPAMKMVQTHLYLEKRRVFVGDGEPFLVDFSPKSVDLFKIENIVVPKESPDSPYILYEDFRFIRQAISVAILGQSKTALDFIELIVEHRLTLEQVYQIVSGEYWGVHGEYMRFKGICRHMYVSIYFRKFTTGKDGELRKPYREMDEVNFNHFLFTDEDE